MLLTAVVGITLIDRIAQPLTPLRVALLVFCCAYVVLGCTLFTSFFGVASLSPLQIATCVAIIAASTLAFLWLYRYSTTKAQSTWDALPRPGSNDPERTE